MDKVLSKVIGRIKDDMNQHAHDAMLMGTPDLPKYCEITGAYRGMQHCLDIIDNILRDAEESEKRS